ncbi:MAG: transporter substrate-binding domain-containing protein [Lachnospiraceae bacterium]|nr:transporter substrate-binding domain-containing protein [Lachnospiraceae bacterium]
MKNRKITAVILTAALGASVFTGCKNSAQATTQDNAAAETQGSSDGAQAQEGQSSDEVREIKVAFDNALFPIAYLDDDGNPAGTDIEALKQIDEALPQYTFTFEGVGYDAGYTGLSTGAYQIMLSNAFWTEERAEKYGIPEHPLGASVVDLVTRKEDSDVTTLKQVSEKGLSIGPVIAGCGMWYIYDNYNKDNPDAQVEVPPTSDPNAMFDIYEQIPQGRYDAYLVEKSSFDNDVAAESGAYHAYYDQLNGVEYTSVYTYPIINKSETDLLAAIDEQLGRLYDEGVLQSLAQEYHGYNTFAYVEDEKKTDIK